MLGALFFAILMAVISAIVPFVMWRAILAVLAVVVAYTFASFDPYFGTKAEEEEEEEATTNLE